MTSSAGILEYQVVLGMSSPLTSLALINAVIFGVHGQVCKQFAPEHQHSLRVQFAAGATAGAIQAFISSPMVNKF